MPIPRLYQRVPNLYSITEDGSSIETTGRAYRRSDFVILRTLESRRIHIVRSKHNHALYIMRTGDDFHNLPVLTSRMALPPSAHANPFLVNVWGAFRVRGVLNNDVHYSIEDYIAGPTLAVLLKMAGRFPGEVVKFYVAEILASKRVAPLTNIIVGPDGHIRICGRQFTDNASEAEDWSGVGPMVYEMLTGDAFDPSIDASDRKWPALVPELEKNLILSLMRKSLTAAEIRMDAWFGDRVDWALLEGGNLDAPFRPDVKHVDYMGHQL